MQDIDQKNHGVDCGNFGDDKQTVEVELDPVETVRLYQIAESIDWLALEKEIIPILGSHSGPIVRLVCGVIYLKSFCDLSSAEVIERWPACSEFRYFCGNKTSGENTMVFPIPLHALDMLVSKLDGNGHDAMIRALLATSADRDMRFASRTIH